METVKIRRRGPLTRGRVRLRGEQHARAGDQVIQVPLGWFGRTYAYVCRGPVRVGSVVLVHGAFSGSVQTVVVGFGRGGYDGPLKRARVIR